MNKSKKGILQSHMAIQSERYMVHCHDGDAITALGLQRYYDKRYPGLSPAVASLISRNYTFESDFEIIVKAIEVYCTNNLLKFDRVLQTLQVGANK